METPVTDAPTATSPGASGADEKTEPLATIKRPGVFLKLYPKTAKDGKAAVYGRFARRRSVKNDSGAEQWEDNPWINSMNDLDYIIEACVEAKQHMRDFYRDRDSGADASHTSPVASRGPP